MLRALLDQRPADRAGFANCANEVTRSELADDMDRADTLVDRRDRLFELGDHAARDHAVGDRGAPLCYASGGYPCIATSSRCCRTRRTPVRTPTAAPSRAPASSRVACRRRMVMNDR